jgi:hypothetical protein
VAYLEQPLQTLAEFIQNEGYSCQYIPSNDAFPIDLLVVVLGRELKEQVLLEMTYPLDFVPDLDLEPGEDDQQADPAPPVLQFLARFKLLFKGERKSELALFMLEVNRSLPLGAFGLCPETGVMYLHHNLVSNSETYSDAVIRYVLDSLDLFITLIAPRLFAIAEGQEDIAAALKILSRQHFNIAPMLASPLQSSES